MHKDSKWARQLIDLQDAEGKWGQFHSLSSDSKLPCTTEQALRRLEILGYTIEDGCIQKAVTYMSDCLSGVKEIPDRREKLHDWDLFTSMMLAAWIRRFTGENAAANAVAGRWAEVVTAAFAGGTYCHSEYVNAYKNCFGMKPRGGRLVDFVQFYVVSLIRGCLDEATEAAVLAYIISKPDGIYYVYDRCIGTPPEQFAGKTASRYLGAVELLAEYNGSRKLLGFVADWLESYRNANGKWDLGSSARDGIYLPLSDDWRKRERREADCTERIERLLGKLR